MRLNIWGRENAVWQIISKTLRKMKVKTVCSVSNLASCLPQHWKIDRPEMQLFQVWAHVMFRPRVWASQMMHSGADETVSRKDRVCVPSWSLKWCIEWIQVMFLGPALFAMRETCLKEPPSSWTLRWTPEEAQWSAKQPGKCWDHQLMHRSLANLNLYKWLFLFH